MLKKSDFEGKANKIYDINKKDWGSKYYGKVIAIDLDDEKLIAVANSLTEQSVNLRNPIEKIHFYTPPPHIISHALNHRSHLRSC